jgi:hypothetical protein
VATRDIRTSVQDTVCDVCGRTLLRGEQSDVYLDGRTPRQVCELCKDRAVQEGWVREGTLTGYENGAASIERRSTLLGRLRSRRNAGLAATPQAPTLRDELDGHAWSDEALGLDDEELLEAVEEIPAEPPPASTRPPARERARGRDRSRSRRAASPRRAPASESVAQPSREPRSVRAVPSSGEQKAAKAVALFNTSEHPRTVAGVARSLGAPGVCLIPASSSPSVVTVTVWWELCWYRYEVDLSDDVPSVRQTGQGYELTELTAAEQQANAVADDRGALQLAG